ncbi:uncharacterized protein LOC132038519 [Lycium ferocissimum]|uniref:uncharacterized protein LOC132038519 n=1 Tax=Lycium ferocissimum TaxID=112874 RepID=UPI00281619E0|nr:uncharacterized protein LOC132038519 [Lycium ferocissimum]
MSLFWDYHGTHGHQTADCRHLRDEVVRLLKDSHLREFLSDRAKDNYGKNKDLVKQEVQTEPRHVINMITDKPMQTEAISPVKKDELLGINRQRALKSKQKNVFSVDDKREGEISPRYDDLIISAMVNNCIVTGLAIVPTIVENIIQWGVIEQLAMIGELEPSVEEIGEVAGPGKIAKGFVELLIVTGGCERNTKFRIINGGMDFKVLLRRP